MNLVDLFAILPYFVNFIVDHLSGQHHVYHHQLAHELVDILNVQSVCSWWLRIWVGFIFMLVIPLSDGSAWADGNLAEPAMRPGKMVELRN